MGVLGLVGADVVDVEHGAVVFVAVRFDPGGERRVDFADARIRAAEDTARDVTAGSVRNFTCGVSGYVPLTVFHASSSTSVSLNSPSRKVTAQ